MIRRLESQDIPKILEWVGALKSAEFNWSAEALRDVFSEITWVYVEAEVPLAFVSLKDVGAASEILCLATHPSWQGNGLMVQLLLKVIDAHSRNEVLWLEVHEKNQKARYLYEKLGFVQVGVRKAYYSDGGAALLFERPAGSVPIR